MDPYAAGLYLVPPSQRHRLLAGADPGFVPYLLELCRRHAIDVLVPTVDVELLAIARARHAFESIGVRLILASEETLTICLDKLTLLRTCDSIDSASGILRPRRSDSSRAYAGNLSAAA